MKHILHRTILLKLTLVAAFYSWSPVLAQEARLDRPIRPTNTFSIIARDPESGELGAAVHTHWFAVGVRVIRTEPGIGVVATQSFTDPSYAPLGLEMMKAGKTAPQALKGLLAADSNASVRQVAMLDADGNVAAHTGSKNIQNACNISGENYSVQANMMKNSTVCSAMAQAFEATSGELADRMYAALEAAQKEGGDIRGRQSASLQVVKGDKGVPLWQGWVYSLRVDDHKTPLKELGRLLSVAKTYRLLNEGDRHVVEGRIEEGLEAYRTAEKMDPGNHEALFWHAVTLAELNRVEESLPLFRKAFRLWPDWKEMVTRLPKAGLLPEDPKILAQILEQGN